MPDELNIAQPTSDDLTSSSAQNLQAAEFQEEEQRLSGSVQEVDQHDSNASSDNPPGATAFGEGEDNTPVEEVPPPRY